MDIERYLHEEAVLARPPSQLYRLQKLVRRNRMVFLSGAAAVAALLLGSIISTWLFIKEREAFAERGKPPGPKKRNCGARLSRVKL